MFALVKPDLRACTRLLSVAAAARRSPLLLLAARRCCWISILMEPARTVILPLGACRTLLPLLLLHATAAARRSDAACPAVLAAACPAVLAAALLACTKRQQHFSLRLRVLVRLWLLRLLRLLRLRVLVRLWLLCAPDPL